MHFLGEYKHTIDAKQRLAIPSEIRDAMNPKVHGEAFVAAPGPNETLWLWPERTFDALGEELGGSLLEESPILELKQHLFSQSAHLPIDSAGRVRFPEQMLANHGLAGTIIIIGVGDHLELRHLDRWQQERQEKGPRVPDMWREARKAHAARLASAAPRTERNTEGRRS